MDSEGEALFIGRHLAVIVQAAHQKETGDTPITYVKVMDKCKENEPRDCNFVAMASDNSQ